MIKFENCHCHFMVLRYITVVHRDYLSAGTKLEVLGLTCKYFGICIGMPTSRLDGRRLVPCIRFIFRSCLVRQFMTAVFENGQKHSW
jgi:hypothetical protein